MNATLKHDDSGLIEANRSYARAIAGAVMRTLAANADRDDVIGAAELGLVEAARVFDPARGVSFKTFAHYRIRGAIYDALRKTLGRQEDPRLRFESAANEYLGEWSAARSVGSPAGHDLEQLTEAAGAVMTGYLLSLDQMPCEVADEDGPNPEQIFERRESSEQVRDAIAHLPERNRKLIEDYYYHDLSLEEIGRKMGLSKSWTCRLHAKSLELLRTVLESAGKSSPAHRSLMAAGR